MPDQCFLLCVELKKGGCLLSRSTYFPKCLKRLQNPEQLAALRNAPAENLYFSEAPWLKPCIEAAKQATLTVTVKPVQENSFGYPRRTVMVQNMSDTPAYPVVLEVVGQDIRHMESDNFFLLAPGEQREVVVTLDRTVAETAQLAAKAWNCETVTVKL